MEIPGDGLFFMQSGIVQLWIGLLVLVLVTVVAVYVIKKIQPNSASEEPITSEMLAQFRKLHDRNELSDEEFQTIRATLAVQLQEEVKSNDQKG